MRDEIPYSEHDPPESANSHLYVGEFDVERFVRTTAATATVSDATSLACALGETAPDRWRWAWETHVDWTPRTVDVAQLVSGTHSPTISDGSGAESLAEVIVRERTITQSDLTSIGAFVSESIESWVDRTEDAASDDRLLVCFDDVEGFLDYHTREDVFKFLYVVGQRVEAAGGVFVAFLDSSDVDQETTIVLSEVFDVAARVDENRTVTIS